MVLTQVLASFRYMVGQLFCTWSVQMTWNDRRKATLKLVTLVGRRVGHPYNRLPQARRHLHQISDQFYGNESGALHSTLYMWKGFSQLTDMVVCGIFANALPKPGFGFAVWGKAGIGSDSRKIHASGPWCSPALQKTSV